MVKVRDRVLGKRTPSDDRVRLPFKKGTERNLFDTVKRNSWELRGISLGVDL